MCALLLLSEGQATEQVEEPADLLGSQVLHVVQDTLQTHTHTRERLVTPTLLRTTLSQIQKIDIWLVISWKHVMGTVESSP